LSGKPGNVSEFDKLSGKCHVLRICCYIYRQSGKGKSDAKSPGICLRISINSVNFYLLKMSRDTHKRLFNCEQDNKALTAAQLINYTMKEKEKLNAYKIAYGGVHIHCTGFYLMLKTVIKIR